MDWIKVAPETMPPDGQEVIATVIWRNEKRIEFGLYREDNEWRQDYDGMDGGGTEYYLDNEVTHWMPYPEPAED